MGCRMNETGTDPGAPGKCTLKENGVPNTTTKTELHSADKAHMVEWIIEDTG